MSKKNKNVSKVVFDGCLMLFKIENAKQRIIRLFHQIFVSRTRVLKKKNIVFIVFVDRLNISSDRDFSVVLLFGR